MSVQVICSEALAHLRTMPDDSVDAIVTDPPYGLSQTGSTKVVKALQHWLAGEREYVPAGQGFMNKRWDAFVPPPALWDESLRILKPGGHAVVFAGARTQDLMGISLRLAGFEIRDSLAWLYSSGLPHGQNLETAARRSGIDPGELAGLHTALKPALEPIILARKKPEGSMLNSVQKWNTGGLDINACRVAHASAADLAESAGKNQHGRYGTKHGGNAVYGNYETLGTREDYDGTKGRFPSNVIISHSPDCARRGEVEIQSSRHYPTRRGKGDLGSSGHQGQDGLREVSGSEIITAFDCAVDCPAGRIDGQSPAASRFFPVLYEAKAPAKERPKIGDIAHPTVKPVNLMRWLIRLLRPGLVCDPFAGSGTTVEACLLEGVDVIAIEKEIDYIGLIGQRIERHSSP